MTPHKSPLRASIPLLASLLAFALAAPALGAPKRAGVPKFDGAQEAMVRKKVMQVLKAKGYALVKSREMEVALANTGALLDSEDGVAKVAKELALAVVITGEVGKKRAKLVAHDGRDGSALGQAVFTSANPRKLAAEVGRDFWKKLGAAIEKGKTPAGAKKPQKSPVAEAPEDDENAADSDEEGGESKPAAASEPVASAEASEERTKKKRRKIKMDGDGDGSTTIEAEEEDGPPATGAVPLFDIAVGPSGINRNFAYNQSLAGLRPYSLPMGPAIAASLSLYPLAAVTDGWARYIGLDVRLEYAFLITSSLGADTTFPQGATFGTSVREYSGGLRYALPLGGGHQLFFGAGGGEHAFVFRTQSADAPRANLDIPDTIYRFARVGGGARFDLGGGLSVSVGAGYRAVLNGGGTHVERYFPHRSVGGVDAQAAIGYQVTPDLEIRGGVDFRRYFYNMNSQCSPAACDQYVAGGAVDQYLAVSGLIAYRFGGGASEEPAEEPASGSTRKRPPSSDEGSGEGEGGAADE